MLTVDPMDARDDVEDEGNDITETDGTVEDPSKEDNMESVDSDWSVENEEAKTVSVDAPDDREACVLLDAVDEGKLDVAVADAETARKVEDEESSG